MNFILNTRLLTSLLILSIASVSGQNTQLKKARTLQAISRTDNSFVTYKDSVSKKVSIPAIVLKEVNKLLMVGNRFSEETKKNPEIFKINYKANVSIYVIKCRYTNGISYKFIAFDSVRNMVTKNPLSINGKWMENNEEGFNKEDRILTSPLIYFKDIDGDGEKDILLKERVHNGSVYNAVIEHICSINKTMDFRPIVCLETSCEYLLDNGGLIKRRIKDNTIFADIKQGNKITPLGIVKLDKKNNFTILSSKCYNPQYEGLLVTGSGIKNDIFLRQGYRFEY